jgi:putative ABC transport system permease protein
VLGATIPAQLWANGAAMIGQEIRIAGIPFTVLGVLAEKGGGPGSNDNDVLIPFETARYRVIGTDRLRTISVKARDVASMTLAMIEIERVLRRGTLAPAKNARSQPARHPGTFGRRRRRSATCSRASPP